MQYTAEEYKAFGIEPPTKKKQKPEPTSGYTAEEYKAFGIEQPKDTIAAPTQPVTPQQMAQPVQAVQPTQPVQAVQLQESKPISFDQLYKDSNNFNKIESYAVSRFGDKEKFDPAKETQEDYVKRFASHMRMARDNLLSSGQELAFIANAKRDDVLKAKQAYDLFENTAGYFSAEGQKGVRPVLDVLGSIASDPVNLVSAGIGSIAKSAFTKTAAEKGMSAAIKSRLGALSAVPLTEGVGAASQNATSQKIELSTDKAKLDRLKELLPKLTPFQIDTVQPEITALEDKVKAGVSGAQVAIAGGIGALTGTIETGSILGAGKAARVLQGEGKTNTGTLKDILDTKREATIGSPKVEVKAADSTMKSLEDAYDIFEGQKLLAKEGSPTAIAQMQVRNDINQKASIIAQDIWKDMPSLAPKAEEKVSDAIKRTLSDVDTINDDQFMKSLSAADVTPEEFAKMFRASVGDAGRTLQSLSVVKRLENKMRSIDPAAAKELDGMYGGRNALTSAFVGLRDVGMRVDRELKALMVSQLSTTIRNGFSGMAVVTFGAASEAIESSLYRIGKTVSELATGSPVTGSFTGGLKGVYDDALRTMYYLRRGDLSSDTTDELLKGTPSLMRIISKTSGETEAKNLSKPAQIANTLNVAQDSFFRKAIFTASVEKQLSRVGIDMYDVLAQGKSIPFDVLKNATDEALIATFSKMPTKGPMFHAVKFVEELGPIGSTVIPFPRFMANAMSWTYKHSPMGVFSGAADIAKGSLLLKQGNEEGQKYLMRGLENTSKGSVGVAAIYASYKYRQEHQEGNWYDIKNPDGSTVDARVLFPLAPYLALGDYLVKLEKGRTDEFKTKEFVEAMTGFKAPAGTYSWLGDKFAESFASMQTGEGSADQKLSKFFGEWAGEYFGRALVPVQQISDIIGAIDRDETLPRDAYQIPAGEEGFTSSATNQLMKRIPIVKQQLPVYQPATKENASYNDNGILKMFTGIAIKGNPSEVENEITRLHVEPNKIFTSTGDKVVDAEARKVMAPLLVQTYDAISKTDYYKQASQDVQKIMLNNTLSYTQKIAKEIATSESKADAFSKGEQPRIFEIKYAALPAEVRRATAEMYKQQTGKDLIDTKEYLQALSYANIIKGLPNFAKGGLVHMAGGGAAAKVAGDLLQVGAKKVTKDVLQEVEEMVMKNEASGIVPKATRAIDQTKQLLAPTEAPRMTSKVVKQDDPFIPTIDDEAGAVGRSAFDDFVDTPVVSGNKEMTAAVPDTAPPAWFTQAADVIKANAEKMDASMPFSAEQYSAGEAAMKAKYGDALFESKKKFFPETYAEELHYETANASGLSADKIPAYKSADEMAVDEIEYDMDGNPIDTNAPAPVVKPLVEKPLKDATWKAGDLGVKVQDTTSSRKKALEEIRIYRTDAYQDLINNDAVKALPDADTVAAVAQGDFRFKTGRELNPKNAKDMAEFVNMAQQYQNNLDKLRVKYKDVPDMKLYHGSTSYRSTGKELAENGFNNPQTDTRQHSELNIGGVSFTKDVNLNFETGDFGGKKAEQFVYTQLPYADYVFQRINMTPIAYDSKNLNVVARSINGSSNVVRPISLPRSGAFKETEDVFVEADKLMPVDKAAGKQPRLQWGKEEIEGKLATKVQQPTGTGPFPETPVLRIGGEDRIDIEKTAKERLFGLSNKLERVSDPAVKNRLAYNAYDGIRSLLNNAMDRASITSTKTGMGQRYQKFLEDLSDSIAVGVYPDKQTINTRDFINNVATILEQSGPNQKAKMLRELNDKLDQINSGHGSRSAIKAVDEVRKLTQKFAKGGLASRR
jgi:hypothetical protein